MNRQFCLWAQDNSQRQFCPWALIVIGNSVYKLEADNDDHPIGQMCIKHNILNFTLFTNKHKTNWNRQRAMQSRGANRDRETYRWTERQTDTETYQRHDNLLTERVDWWIGDLCKELFEVLKYSWIVLRQTSQRSIIAHWTQRLLPAHTQLTNLDYWNTVLNTCVYEDP